MEFDVSLWVAAQECPISKLVGAQYFIDRKLYEPATTSRARKAHPTPTCDMMWKKEAHPDYTTLVPEESMFRV